MLIVEACDRKRQEDQELKTTYEELKDNLGYLSPIETPVPLKKLEDNMLNPHTSIQRVHCTHTDVQWDITFYVYVCFACTYICAPCVSQVASEIRSGYLITWD